MNVVFAIGCKRYSDPDVAQLKYADQDARRFVETVLHTQDPDNIEQYLLYDGHEVESFRPTRSNILRFLSRGARRDKSTELDFLFFYFSGHGWSSKDGTDYLLTSDSIVDMPDITAISVPMLEGHLRNWEAKHAVLFIDACRTVVTGGKSITIADESRIDVDSLCPPGMVTFCSCEPGQTSYEADPIHSGVFTEGVCRALGDEGRCSTIQELDTYLNDTVPRISDKYGLPRQIPYSRLEPLAVQKALIISQRTFEEWQTQKLDDLYARARRSHHDQKWQAVVDIFEQIHAEDPTYPDQEGLLTSAREALEAEERIQRVATLYDQGQRHMKAEEWQQALECFEEVQRLEPNYRETEALLEQARQRVSAEDTGKTEAGEQPREEMARPSTDQAERVRPDYSAATQPQTLLPMFGRNWWALVLAGAIMAILGLIIVWAFSSSVGQSFTFFRLLTSSSLIAIGVFTIIASRTAHPKLLLRTQGIISGLAGLVALLSGAIPPSHDPADFSNFTAALQNIPFLVVHYSTFDTWALTLGIIQITAAIRVGREFKVIGLMVVSGASLLVYGMFGFYLLFRWAPFTPWLVIWLLASGILLGVFAIRDRQWEEAETEG